MFKLLKKLFSTKGGSRTVVVLDDDGSKPSASHRLSPINLWLLFLSILGGTILLVLLVILTTPLGNFISDQQDVRNSVIAIQKKVAVLQDTLQARNIQLRQMQAVMATGKDTIFANVPAQSFNNENNAEEDLGAVSTVNPNGEIQRLPADAQLISNLLQRSPQFPAPYPTEGTTTRLFNTGTGHFGIDIAAEAGSLFRAVADGSIINQEWTINYGYVIIIQHGGGIITVYKHASSIEKSTGESVLKRDVLGTVGDVGILSSGPHLHVEIWENGIPLNPQNYLINS